MEYTSEDTDITGVDLYATPGVRIVVSPNGKKEGYINLKKTGEVEHNLDKFYNSNKRISELLGKAIKIYLDIYKEPYKPHEEDTKYEVQIEEEKIG